MHLLLVAAYVSGIGVLGAALRRWVLRPLRYAIAELRGLIAQLRETETLRHELRELAGSVTRLAVALLQENEQRAQRVDDLTQLMVEVAADVARVQQAVGELQMTA